MTEEWIRESGAAHAAGNLHTLTEQPVDSIPIFLVALHACGSLTLDVLRAFVQQLRRAQRGQGVWRPAGGLIVGCCYNLLRSEGEP